MKDSSVKVKGELNFAYKGIKFMHTHRYSRSQRKGHLSAMCISATLARIHPSHTATNDEQTLVIKNVKSQSLKKKESQNLIEQTGGSLVECTPRVLAAKRKRAEGIIFVASSRRFASRKPFRVDPRTLFQCFIPGVTRKLRCNCDDLRLRATGY